MSPRSQSPKNLTEFVASLYASIWAVKTAFWMGFGGSLAKNKPDHLIYIEAFQLAKGHMAWDLPTGWSLPTSRHHVIFPLKKYNAGNAQQVFWVGGCFGSVIFAKQFLFNLFLFLQKGEGGPKAPSAPPSTRSL